MVAIPWERLAQNPDVVEGLVTMLVLRLRPRAHAVDGSGGDGGRDVFECTEDNQLVHYEVKSFTGRLTDSQKGQVVRSLISTARYQPDHWGPSAALGRHPGRAALVQQAA